MKIHVIGTRGFPRIEGGVEKHCEVLYPLLDDDIEICVYRRKPFVCAQEEYDNITFIDLPSTRIKGVEAVLHSFLATMHALFRKPDAVHYHNIGPAMFSPFLKLRNIPVVLTFHSPNYEHKKWGNFARKLLLFSEKIALKTADSIIFVNRFQMEKYPKDIREKSVYIPNGVKLPTFSPNTDFLAKIGVEPNKYILSVGRITQEKGFDTLIKAYCHSGITDMKLVIAGGAQFETAYLEQLKKLAGDRDVIFTGDVFGDQLAQLYTHAGLYVLASNNEGFPLVLLEAMSYHLDVLVSDIPATHLVDLPQDDYFPRADAMVLSQKLKEKMQNIRKVEYDLSEYNWNRVARVVSELFYKVVGR